ncbi:E3 ubiquitin-protein ligase [Nymphaea thermarum]|nr:E3 ubiquitin-protein ligase [Nymphaea thermarum]
MRQNLSNTSVSGSEHGHSRDNDIIGMVPADASPYTVRGRPRGRQRVHSDNDSDVDSIIGESDTNASISGYGAFLADSDAVSFNGYGLNSDASLDRQSLADREMFMQWNESHIGSDTDIDPMHAGISHWNSDDDGEEDDEDGEWEEADAEEVVEESNNQNTGVRSTGEGSEPSDREQVRHSAGSRRGDIWRRDDAAHNLSMYRHAYMSDLFVNLRTEVQPFVGDSGDYLDERGFEELLIQLAETDSLTRGAPPAAGSVVSSLPRVIISEVHEEHGIVICAVCKDPLVIGTEATQLPCSHLYHPSCILPWLSSRNSCPVCRYELLTDDKDYEEGKRNTNRTAGNELHHMESSGDSSSDTSDDEDGEERRSSSQWFFRIGGLQLLENDDGQIENEITDQNANETNFNHEACVSDGTATGGRSRGGWFLFAAAPIVSIMGIVLVLWFGNPLIEGRLNRSIRQHDQQQLNGSSGGSTGLLNVGNRNRNKKNRVALKMRNLAIRSDL